MQLSIKKPLSAIILILSGLVVSILSVTAYYQVSWGVFILIAGIILATLGLIIIVLANRRKGGTGGVPTVSRSNQPITPEKLQVTITPQKVKMLEKLILHATRVKIDDMAGVLDVPRSDLLRKLLELSDQFDFKIEEDVVAFGASASTEFVTALEKEFEKWGQSTVKQ